ncbi:hypothetical protein GOY49_018835 [Klebsiella pneumoniae]|uniref:hypothetical protein n=1 Tax=Klebsiella pneumoniae TaxID=573 RepID=UPI0010846FCB|nr:hypothetical protein [Klebsiella pneumoniae]EKV3348887.1 hypothetical protein [Klebsiella pneumoniae]EKW5278291.1 hypothetical protein [Klebsiella pneumoniae]MBD8290061.1 hypothetical protein [Klebsiella pneumoniae]MCI7886222.1 hypothetical protein [Klebsiella pneumoniae]MCP5932552.1 hypothetical protein [Klebsiella pneumoniae]
MADINFVIPISGYSGIPVNDIVDSLISGETVDDICLTFQSKSNATGGDESSEDGKHGFLYDYLHGIFHRYPEFLQSVNALRTDSGAAIVKL